MQEVTQSVESPFDPSKLDVKIFADGADLDRILELALEPHLKGFTTNPTLMRKSGVTDFEGFAREVLAAVPDHPVSIEVFSDEFATMKRQALKIASWGDNVNVKIPVTDTKGKPTEAVVRDLAGHGVKLNVTGLMSTRQVELVADWLGEAPASFVSLFAGRIADTGRDPVPYVVESLDVLSELDHVELIWASPREVFNVVQADAVGCDVITVTHDLLAKLPSIGKDLEEFSLETVQMFNHDALAAGYKL